MNPCSQYGLTTTDISQHNQLGLAWLGLAWLGLAWLGLAWLGLAWLAVKERLFLVSYTGTKNQEDIIENGMHKVCDSLWYLFLFHRTLCPMK